ncbi:uncharacterized protein VTP21DRAFT_5442 [Calcarisporiella thermophila]|uniref:uncharacterized protein n=1 Tax=Calcarisporiella thermophila TaxID=911321 RepID=UPI003743E7AF
MEKNTRTDNISAGGFTYPPPPPPPPAPSHSTSPQFQSDSTSNPYHQPSSQYQQEFNYPPPPRDEKGNIYQGNTPYYQPAPQQQVVYADTTVRVDNNIPLILFIAGFCFPILWLVGSCYLRTPDPKQRIWAKLSLVCFILTLIGVIVAVVLYIKALNTVQCIYSSYSIENTQKI